jgi:hypothetical protein
MQQAEYPGFSADAIRLYHRNHLLEMQLLILLLLLIPQFCELLLSVPASTLRAGGIPQGAPGRLLGRLLTEVAAVANDVSNLHALNTVLNSSKGVLVGRILRGEVTLPLNETLVRASVARLLAATSPGHGALYANADAATRELQRAAVFSYEGLAEKAWTIADRTIVEIAEAHEFVVGAFRARARALRAAAAAAAAAAVAVGAGAGAGAGAAAQLAGEDVQIADMVALLAEKVAVVAADVTQRLHFGSSYGVEAVAIPFGFSAAAAAEARVGMEEEGEGGEGAAAAVAVAVAVAVAAAEPAGGAMAVEALPAAQAPAVPVPPAPALLAAPAQPAAGMDIEAEPVLAVVAAAVHAAEGPAALLAAPAPDEGAVAMVADAVGAAAAADPAAAAAPAAAAPPAAAGQPGGPVNFIDLFIESDDDDILSFDSETD